MDGIVVKWEQADYAIGRIENQSDWWQVAGDAVEPDVIGRVLLVAGEPVTFDPGPDIITKKNAKRIRRAVNVRRPWKVTNIDPKTHREICAVVNENWLARVSGGWFTVERTELYPGQVVEVSVRPPDVGKTWRAFDIKVIHEDAEMFDWSSVPILPEIQEPAEQEPIVIAPKSVLLSDRFRGKKLRSIKIRKATANV